MHLGLFVLQDSFMDMFAPALFYKYAGHHSFFDACRFSDLLECLSMYATYHTVRTSNAAQGPTLAFTGYGLQVVRTNNAVLRKKFPILWLPQPIALKSSVDSCATNGLSFILTLE